MIEGRLRLTPDKMRVMLVRKAGDIESAAFPFGGESCL